MNLYHYCSQEAFLSIISTKSFWCTALSLSNDTMEGKWIRKIFSEICDEKKMETQDKNSLITILDLWLDSYEGLGFCFSELGDSLSQWRGYAQNAEGFCIGFSKEGLELLGEKMGELGTNLIQVNYDIEQQRKELEPTYQRIKALVDKGALRPQLLTTHTKTEEEKKEDIKHNEALNQLYSETVTMLPKVFRHKNPAFAEEKEWRAVSIFHKPLNLDIEFRSVGDRIVPYRRFEFDPASEIITEVILGPKNQTPIEIIQIALRKFGYKSVKLLKKSEASYR